MAAREVSLESVLSGAHRAGHLRDSTIANIRRFLGPSQSPVYVAAISELASARDWAELDDRFFRTLAFGTGGLRGRTIGKIVTKAERGKAPESEPPEFPCVGTNAMNFYNVSRATQGLVAYLREWRAQENLEGKPKIVIAHDTRHYSKQFAELVAQDRGGEWLRRRCLRRAEIDARTVVRRALSGGKRGHRHHCQPQPAA